MIDPALIHLSVIGECDLRFNKKRNRKKEKSFSSVFQTVLDVSDHNSGTLGFQRFL